MEPATSTPFIHWIDVLVFMALVILAMGAYVLCANSRPARKIIMRAAYYLLRPVVWISAGVDRLVRLFRKPRWRITGHCRRCGECCHLLAMGLSPFMSRRAYLQDIIRWYYEANYGFHYEGLNDGRWMMFCCPHLDRDNLCRIYRRRPRICREYPSPYQAARPDVPPECGYHVHES
jgi:hypothetical protein